LRGASDDSDMLKMEDDSIQTHAHEVNDPGHTHRYDDSYEFWDKETQGFDWGTSLGHKTHTQAKTTYERMTGITVNHPTGAGVRVDEETRPKNMRVIYIMRVY